MRTSTRPVVVTSLLSIAAPFVCGAALAWPLYQNLGTGSGQLPFVLFLGAAMSVTAFPVLARILAERNIVRTRIGIIAIACAAVNDIAAWCLLAVITVMARPEPSYGALFMRFAGLAAYCAVMMLAVRPLLKRLLPVDEPPSPGRFALTMIVLLVSVWTTEALAVHALFGAFFAGAVMPRGGPLETGLRQRVESVALILLLPLFFAYNGLRTSVGLLNTPELVVLCIVIIAVAIGSKLLVTAAGMRVSGMSWRDSLTIGVLLNTRGLVELVILNVGLELGILSPALFSMMVIMALITTFMTGPLLDWIQPRSGFNFPSKS
jgi:Kef-type K+ transport system membrane component KefB